MAMAYPNDLDADKILPQCPEDVADQLHRKQFAAYRKALLKTITEVRAMLWPLGERQARFVLNGLAVSLKAFISAKQGKTGKVVAKTPAPPVKVVDETK